MPFQGGGVESVLQSIWSYGWWFQPNPPSRGCTLAGNFNLFKGPAIGDFGGVGGPGGLGDPPERRGVSPPYLSEGFPGPQGPPK